MSDELARLSLALSYPGPGGESRKVPSMLLEAPFQALNVGRIDIPDGTQAGTPIGIPFGSIGVGASLVLFKNTGNQELALRLAGATSDQCRIPIGGVFSVGGSAPSANAITEATLLTTATQVGDGSVDYWVFGDAVEQDPVAPMFRDPGAHGSATGVYTESTLTFASSIDSALTSLTALYTHDNGVAAAMIGGLKMPLVAELHGYNGDENSITAADAQRAAARGCAVIRIGMRGRTGQPGSADDSARELYDLLDAIAAVEAAHGTIVDTTRLHILGFSGGGANALAFLTKFPGLATTVVACFGFGDYGVSNTRSFWALSGSDRTTLETRIGNRLADIKPFVSRNANLTIAKALPLSSTKLVMLWDSADTQTFALQRETRDALLAGGVDQSQWYWQESTDGHWAHGYVADNANLKEAENVIFNRVNDDAPTFAKVGTIDVNGYLVTPDVEIWSSDPTDYAPRTGGLGGTKHRLRVDFDATAGHYSIRSLTGACNVLVRRRSDGLELCQALSATGTATFELDQASHMGEAIAGSRFSYSTVYGPLELDGTTPESGETVESWLDRMGTGSTLAKTAGTPVYFPTPQRVLFDASSTLGVVDDIAPTADFWFAVVFSLSSQTNYAPVCWFDGTDVTVARINLQIDATHVMLAIRNTAGTDVYATKLITLVADQWYLAICERVGGNFQCTVNALSAATVASPGGTLLGNKFQIGRGRQGGSEFFGFAGYLRGIAGGQRSLVAAERARLYKFAQLIHGVT
jgi:pimeloyl-ACP methyl ester carboxylesterase